jgi:hypothetical protein
MTCPPPRACWLACLGVDVKAWLEDLIVSAGIALLIVVLMLFASFDSTFIYQGF